MTQSGRQTMFARVVWFCAGMLACGCGLASVVGLAGEVWWRLDLFAHFRVQYAVILAGSALVFVVLRRWLALGLSVAALGLNLFFVAPLYLGSPAPADRSGQQLTLMMHNVHHDNRDHDRLFDYMRQSRADVIIVLEATRAFTERLERELPGYRLVQRSREDAFGIALLSRLPMSHGQVIYPAGGQLPAIEAVIEAHGQRVAVLAIHPPPPVTAELSAERDRVIAAAADWSRAPASGAGAVDHAVVVGDMNATPWSWPMRRLVRDSELIDSLRGHGVQTSWPSQLIPLSIPIDHVLHSPSLTAVERSVGPFMGSDHRPVHVALAPVAN